MPKKEEEKKEKKFKAVIEELSTPHVDTPAIVEPKIPVVVPPTDNIDSSSKISEKGVFLKIFVVTFFATLLAFLLAGGFYVYLTGTSKLETQQGIRQTPEPQITQTPEATMTSEPSVDLTKFKVSVLNGNGGIGVATAAKNVIEKAGFKVASVGNADNFAFTDTVIQVKASVIAEVTAKLKDSLTSANYSVKVGDQLDPASNYDVVVTVGSK